MSYSPCNLDDQNEGKINLTKFLQQVATLPEGVDFELNSWKGFSELLYCVKKHNNRQTTSASLYNDLRTVE